MRRPAFMTACLLAVLVPSAGLAAQGAVETGEGDLLLRVQGPVHIAAGDAVGTVGVIGHDAVVDGTIRGELFVVNGTARIRGRVEGNVIVINGRLELLPGARVEQTAHLYRSSVVREPGAVIAGGIREEMGISFSRFALYFWLGMTFLVLAAGLAYVFLAEQSVEGAARLIRANPGNTVLTAIVVVVGLPMVAFSLIVTGIGIPLGIMLLMAGLPALALLGYLVTGTTVGHLALRLLPRDLDNPYLAAATGLLLLQVVALTPGLGVLAVILASQLGAGALFYRVWRRKRGQTAVLPAHAAG
jgi:cytoskeletal protein CcmA (bactofilin family)